MGRRRRTYQATLVVVWDHWVVQVPEVRGVHALVTRAADAEDAARQAIATVLDVDADSFRVEVQPA